MANGSTENKKPQLIMLHPNLDNLIDLATPEPYRIRSEGPGDAKAWERIISESFQEAYSYRLMTEDKAYRPERVFFLTNEKDVPIATAASWTSADFPADCALMHMVGILPGHSGHHLGLYVSLAAMKYAKKEGFARMALRTDDFRLPAIKTYLRLGFLPTIVHESHIERWKNILHKVRREDLLDSLPEAYDGATIRTI